MSVYYVRSVSDGLVKIGYAGDAKQRFSKIQSDSPAELELVAVEDGSVELEADRHCQFASLRVRGEWFREEGPLAEFIDALPRFKHRRRRKIHEASPLGAWIVQSGHTLASFGELVGSNQTTISRVVNGVHVPRKDLFLAIIEATDWEVDAHDILGFERPEA